MSHTFVGPSGAIYHHNGDFSGDVEVEVEHTHQGGLVSIPFEDMKALVFEYLRQQIIARVEDADYRGLMELFTLGGDHDSH